MLGFGLIQGFKGSFKGSIWVLYIYICLPYGVLGLSLVQGAKGSFKGSI